MLFDLLADISQGACLANEPTICAYGFRPGDTLTFAQESSFTCRVLALLRLRCAPINLVTIPATRQRILVQFWLGSPSLIVVVRRDR